MVEAPIPLLWGKESMKKAEVLLDLPNDRARIKGMWIDLVVSACDHYGVNVLPKSESMVTFERLVAKDDKNEYEDDKNEYEDADEEDVKEEKVNGRRSKVYYKREFEARRS